MNSLFNWKLNASSCGWLALRPDHLNFKLPRPTITMGAIISNLETHISSSNCRHHLRATVDYGRDSRPLKFIQLAMPLLEVSRTFAIESQNADNRLSANHKTLFMRPPETFLPRLIKGGALSSLAPRRLPSKRFVARERSTSNTLKSTRLKCVAHIE